MTAADAVAWNDDGLAPAVAIDAVDGRFLMLAWMNAEALEATLQTGRATFYSRSRKRLWEKGETSGNTLLTTAVRLDCDSDTIVLEVRPVGPACHTGAGSCAFRRWDDGEWADDGGPLGAPAAIVDQVFETCLERKGAAAEKSYTRSLFDGGASAIAAKIDEEQRELTDELGAGPEQAIIHETADLLFHLLVALAYRGVDPQRVWSELRRRTGQSGLEEKSQRKGGD